MACPMVKSAFVDHDVGSVEGKLSPVAARTAVVLHGVGGEPQPVGSQAVCACAAHRMAGRAPDLAIGSAASVAVGGGSRHQRGAWFAAKQALQVGPIQAPAPQPVRVGVPSRLLWKVRFAGFSKPAPTRPQQGHRVFGRLGQGWHEPNRARERAPTTGTAKVNRTVHGVPQIRSKATEMGSVGRMQEGIVHATSQHGPPAATSKGDGVRLAPVPHGLDEPFSSKAHKRVTRGHPSV
jgi:hypothetical protein